MDPRTRERVERWDSRPFSGGYDGLADLAGDEFSGAVDADGTWLFLLNGRVVGVVDGALEDVERAAGTVYAAPHPSLPLLCSMDERGGETRAKYYTNETPLREVDRTLQEGSFTGYVELSENVLSGDYYAVYYGGRRMAAAYIGSAERLLTGDEAFERAADEVGIYEVIDVDVDVTDVPTADAAPEPDDDADERTGIVRAESDSSDVPDPTGPGITDADSPDATAGEPADATTEESTGATVGDASDAAPSVEDRSEDAVDAEPRETADADLETPADPGTPEREESADSGSPDRPPASPDVDATEPAADDDAADASGPDGEREEATDASSSPTPEEVEAAADELEVDGAPWTTVDDAEGTATEPDSSGDAPDDGLEERFKQEERWRETRSIPSLDPDQSETHSRSSGRSQARRSNRGGSGSNSRRRSASTESGDGRQTAAPEPSTGGGDESAATSDAAGPSVGRERDDREELARRVEALTERRDALRTRCERLEAERDELASENEELSAAVERLRGRIDDLESELERRSGGESGSAGGAGLSPERALAETNLFVRYDSKSEPTLATAHDGDADRAEVAANLRLEHHTGFDAGDATVGGTPYGEFLPATLEYRVVDWLVGTLLYEIRDTGRDDGLADLYDAIPRIDRAELRATISLDDDAEEVPDDVTFDVVAFDKRGTPLVVVTLNDSRDPASGSTLARVEEHASAVSANYPDLAAALVVTSSFFDPEALAVAERATEGGFLSRSASLSYVNVSRKRGYHLCLVESRSGGFHVTVPEL